VLPLLANSLERSIQLAETMEARGFGTAVNPPSRRRALLSQVGLLAALVSILGGLALLAFFQQGRVWGWLLFGAGVAGVLAFFGLHGRQVQRTRYRRPTWHARDTLVVIASIISLGIVIGVRMLAAETLYYSPYPPNSLLPSFDPLAGAALLLLTAPAIVARRHAGQTASGSRPGAQDLEKVS
jgi:energy-coupling factor transport system permease protein